MTLRETVRNLMVARHRISIELADYHVSRMDDAEVRRRFRMYARNRISGMELSAVRRNQQSEPDFYQVFGFATATARRTALNPVPALIIEQQNGENPARAGRKKPGPIVDRALSASH